MLIQDARFEQKPYFTIADILERPFAGGVSAFSAISDSFYLPQLEGVKVDKDKGTDHHQYFGDQLARSNRALGLIFKCKDGLEATAKKMASPKALVREMKKIKWKT